MTLAGGLRAMWRPSRLTIVPLFLWLAVPVVLAFGDGLRTVAEAQYFTASGSGERGAGAAPCEGSYRETCSREERIAVAGKYLAEIQASELDQQVLQAKANFEQGKSNTELAKVTRSVGGV